MNAHNLVGWTPVRLRTAAAGPVVDWARIDGPFEDPFFEQTADRAMQHPFNLVFGPRTPLAALEAVYDARPRREPAGLVFHMSRCGSTLLAQMLSRLDDAVVISEAQPLDAVLRLHRDGRVDDAGAIALLRAAVAALTAPRLGERRAFVKFHAWHVLALPLIARAFPRTPWAFVFREPRAVLRSQARRPGAEVVHGNLDPAALGLTATAAAALAPAAYLAHTLAAFCEAGLARAGGEGAICLEYVTPIDDTFARMLRAFGIEATPAEMARARLIAVIDTKGAGEAFAPRPANAADEAAADLLASGRLDRLYAALRRRAAAAR